LSDRVVFTKGHWILLVGANGISYEDQGLVDLVQNATQLHSRLEDKWLLSTTTVDKSTEWCHDKPAVESGCPAIKPLALHSPCLLESYGEHMFMTQTLQWLAVEQVVESLAEDESVMRLIRVQTALPMG
jgi:hypothetical protein